MINQSSIEFLQRQYIDLEAIMENKTPSLIRDLENLKTLLNNPEHGQDILTSVDVLEYAINELKSVNSFVEQVQDIARNYLVENYGSEDLLSDRKLRWDYYQNNGSDVALKMWNDITNIALSCGILSNVNDFNSYIKEYVSRAGKYWDDKGKLSLWKEKVLTLLTDDKLEKYSSQEYIECMRIVKNTIEKV